ncbi:MAG: SMP-30/gluconolactonase/LRE family protein [Rhodospirillales bacterium]|nr:SMP-30/gluconolactonase/LRE family protein [Rhodospirillales bacterium]
MSETARPVGAVRAIVGESPVWSEADRCIYWVDILGGLVHRYETDSGSNRYWRMPEHVGNLVLVDGGGLLVALEGGLHLFVPETGALATLCDIKVDLADQRFNDGTCDPRGRLWIGSMAMEEPVRRAVGPLFRFSPDGTIARMLDGFLIPNGMAFSPDGRTFYVSDSHPSAQTIWAFDYDLDDGALSNRRVFATTHDLPGRPDGGTVDADGFYWSANVGGGCLVRFDPDGRIDRTIDVPTEKPSKVAFGGLSLDVMYITSINHNLQNRDEQGLAGSLFRLDAGIRGLPPNRFGPLEQLSTGQGT